MPNIQISSVHKVSQKTTSGDGRFAKVIDLAPYLDNRREGDVQPIVTPNGSEAVHSQRTSSRIPPRETRSKLEPRVKLVKYAKSSSWVLDCKNPSTGKATNRTLGNANTMTEFEACVMAREILTAITAGHNPFAGGLTVEEHFEQVRLPWAKKNKKSWRDDLGVFNRYIRPAIGHIPMRKITTTDLQSLIDNLMGGGK
jgi:hypothetical protein